MNVRRHPHADLDQSFSPDAIASPAATHRLAHGGHVPGWPGGSTAEAVRLERSVARHRVDRTRVDELEAWEQSGIHIVPR